MKRGVRHAASLAAWTFFWPKRPCVSMPGKSCHMATTRETKAQVKPPRPAQRLWHPTKRAQRDAACLGRQPTHLRIFGGHQRAAESGLCRAPERQLQNNTGTLQIDCASYEEGENLHSGRSRQCGLWRDQCPEHKPVPHQKPSDSNNLGPIVLLQAGG